jgi:hypothetical protein
MSRRPSLPGAAELFRATGGAAEPQSAANERLRRVRPGRDESGEDGRGASVTPLSASAVVAAAPAPAPLHPPTTNGAGVTHPVGVPDLAAATHPVGVPDLAAPHRRDSVEPMVDRAPTDQRVAAAPAERPASPRSPGKVRQTRRQRIRTTPDRQPSGREKHEEKITVYCSPEELFDLESARLVLRGEHGLVVDRGRIVREAVAVVLADLDAKGEGSILVRRLREL